MIISTLILVFSSALLIFYMQSVGERILGREFDREYFRSIVAANRLEFPFVKEAVEQFDVPGDYTRFRMMLRCDFLALTYLLKHTANRRHRYSLEDRVLIWNYKLISFLMSVRRALGREEKPAMIQLTRILQYFANVLGKRVSDAGAGSLFGPDYLLGL